MTPFALHALSGKCKNHFDLFSLFEHGMVVCENIIKVYDSEVHSMNLITVKPELHRFDSCREFAEMFQIGEKDFILASKSTYLKHFHDLNTGAVVAFKSDYGPGEPTDLMCEAIMADVEKSGCTRIIAIGGGAVIDIAKVLAVSDGNTMDELYAKAPALTRKRGLVIVPTTCGTGSEVTNLAIINRTRMGVKMGLGSEEMYANDAVLIPELLRSLPFPVFATSSIDALVHAVESALSPLATPYTRLFSYKAIEMIVESYLKLVKQGRETLPELLEDFLIASNYAGLAFGTAGCAAVHALSYPLGGAYHVPHGESNYALFTGVLKNYMEIKADGEIAILNEKLASLLDCEVANVYDALEELLNQVLPKKPLHEYGVTDEDLDTFTDSVMTTQGRLMAKNFTPLDRDRVYKIYRELW